MEIKSETIFAAGKYGTVASDHDLPEALAMLQVLLLLDKKQMILKSHSVKAASMVCSEKQCRRLAAAAKHEKKFVWIFQTHPGKYAVVFSSDSVFVFYAAGIKEIKEMPFSQAVYYVKKWKRQAKIHENKSPSKKKTGKKQ